MRAVMLASLLVVPGLLAAQGAATTPPPPPSPPPPPPPPPALALKVTGFAEASYAYSRHSMGDTIIVGRLYDRLQNRFTLNAFGVVLDKPYDPAKRSAGFHVEALFGQNATVIKSGGGALDLGTQGDIPHLYVTLNLPTASGSGVQFKAGRIPTLMGLEVIETTANPNWSEGNQFIYVENFTALGVSLETKLNRYLDVQFRVINGWDQVSDNNNRKSLMGRVGISPDTLTSIGLVGFWGPEESGDNTANRYGVEALLWRKLGGAQLWVQSDYGREQANSALPTPGQDAKWWALGSWLLYDFRPSLGLALRGDYVDDESGARTSGSFGFPANTGHKFGSATATLNIRAWPNAAVRPEVRYDRSTLAAFAGKKDQVSVALGVAYLY